MLTDRTLFLDRDGVVNVLLVNDYVKNVSELEIREDFIESIPLILKNFGKVFIVTNQQGVGKGLMTEDDLQRVHDYFLQQVAQAGGRVDRIYYCTALKSAHSFRRKPSIGMALQARRDFADVALKQSVMVGDEPLTATRYPHLVDYCYPTLFDYAKTL